MDVDKLAGAPISVQIKKAVEESVRAVTLYFDMPDRDFLPGQFVMVWIPDVDEIPMSVASWKKPTAGITVQIIGPATEALSKLTTGDWIGIRGPFGNSFTISDYEHALLVGGGVGVAPLYFLCKVLLEQDIKVTAIWAAKTKDELILYDLEKISSGVFNLVITTDDGSMGQKGLATDALRTLLRNNDFDRIYTCGPELMMHLTFKLATEQGIAIEASLERYMKCGCGICGTCSLDPTGELVCMDGPVFDQTRLEKIEEFGRYHRDGMGIKNDC